MANGNGPSNATNWAANAEPRKDPRATQPERPMHPAWLAFVRYCENLRHGDIERLRIRDGLPVLAEVTTKKVKFG